MLVEYRFTVFVGFRLIDSQAEITLTLSLAPFLFGDDSHKRTQLASVWLFAW